MYSKYIENIYYKQQTYFYHNQGYQLYIYIGGGVQGFVLIDPYIYIYTIVFSLSMALSIIVKFIYMYIYIYIYIYVVYVYIKGLNQ